MADVQVATRELVLREVRACEGTLGDAVSEEVVCRLVAAGMTEEQAQTAVDAAVSEGALERYLLRPEFGDRVLLKRTDWGVRFRGPGGGVWVLSADLAASWGPREGWTRLDEEVRTDG